MTVECTSAEEDFVRRTYRAVLGRAGDEAGVTYWTGRLNSGTDRGAVAQALAAGSEGRSRLVNLTYQRVLGRSADQPSRTYWVGRLTGGLSVEEFTALVASSDETFALSGRTLDGYVTRLYSAHLDRPGSTSERAHWVDTLGAPSSARTRAWASRAMGRSAEASSVAVIRATSPYCPSLLSAGELSALYVSQGRDPIRLAGSICAAG